MLRFWDRARKYFRSPGDVALFLRILGLALILPLLQRTMSMPGLLRLLTPRAVPPADADARASRQAKVALFIDGILGRNVWPLCGTCLTRALLRYRFLRHAGLEVRFCLGVRAAGPTGGDGRNRDLQGHAWLLRDGQPILEYDEAATRTFVVTYCYPPQ